ncbi:hypothetical protein NXW19_06370 [Bacteroides ovatus]|nr:hypothetical protein NXW19_06370 [Bacteroides ovatus]
MIHAGQLIERTLHEQGRTVTWFATQLCCTRPNVYKIFRKENIDIHLLWRISCILGHDFFPRSFRQHQYRKLPQCIQIGYNSVSFLELCFHPVVYSFRIPLQAY